MKSNKLKGRMKQTVPRYRFTDYTAQISRVLCADVQSLDTYADFSSTILVLIF